MPKSRLVANPQSNPSTWLRIKLLPSNHERRHDRKSQHESDPPGFLVHAGAANYHSCQDCKHGVRGLQKILVLFLLSFSTPPEGMRFSRDPSQTRPVLSEPESISRQNRSKQALIGNLGAHIQLSVNFRSKVRKKQVFDTSLSARSIPRKRNLF